MARVDIATALIVIALAAVIVYGVSGMVYWSQYSPGPAFMPYWVAGAGFALGGLLLMSAIGQRTDAAPADVPTRAGALRVLLALAGLWMFVAFGSWLGFVPAATLLTLYLLLVVQRAPLLPSLACTAFITALVYGVFVQWLGLSLPRGILGL